MYNFKINKMENKYIALVLALSFSIVNATNYNTLIGKNNFIVKTSEVLPPVSPSPVNLAMSGTNGLTPSSFTASSTYSSDSPAGAFDGYTEREKIIEGDTSKINRGIWLSNFINTNQWISIDFNNNINVTSIKILSRATVPSYNRLAKNIITQKSTDGVVFTDVKSFLAENIAIQSFELDQAINTRYLRVFFVDNYGDTFIQVEEIEVY